MNTPITLPLATIAIAATILVAPVSIAIVLLTMPLIVCSRIEPEAQFICPPSSLVAPTPLAPEPMFILKLGQINSS